MYKTLHIVLIFLLLLLSLYVQAQQVPDLPQRSGSVAATQMLHFGDLTLTSSSTGGSVVVNPDGTRTAFGDVILLNIGNVAQQAIFEYKLCPGRRVTLSYPPTVTLNGQNGGSILLHIGPTNIGVSGSIFSSNMGCDDTHYIHAGGTIDIGPLVSNPPGLYTGSFNIVFIQE
jgi:hypothetical protein